MRTYQLQPGKLLEWEGAWRRGIEARRRFVVSIFQGFETGSGAFRSHVDDLATSWSLLWTSRTIARGSPYLAVPVSAAPALHNDAAEHTAIWRLERLRETKHGRLDPGLILFKRCVI